MNSSLSLPNSDNGTSLNIAPISSLICINIILLIFGLPVNSYVVWLIITGVGSGVVPEFFALNLSVCEIIICFNAIPATIFFLSNKNNVAGPLRYSIGFFSTLLGIGRPLFQCCVCLERYIAVVHPIIFLKYKALRYRVAISAVTWLKALGICAFYPLLPVRIMYYYIILPYYLLLFSTKIFCSVAVLKALRKPGPGGKLSVKEAEANCMKKKAFRVIVIILIAMVISYSPMLIFIFLFDYLSEDQKLSGISVCFYVLTISGLVQPLLYFHRTGKLPFMQSV